MLFRLERNPQFKGGQLGCQWIEVLAVEMRALGPPKKEGEGGWCYQEVHNWYICRTEHGVSRFPAEEIWLALDENKEYVVAGAEPKAKSVPLIDHAAGEQRPITGMRVTDQEGEPSINVYDGKWYCWADLPEVTKRDVRNRYHQLSDEELSAGENQHRTGLKNWGHEVFFWVRRDPRGPRII
jgi:hypothetical protein